MPSAIAPDDTSTTSLPPCAQRGDLLGPAADRGVIEAAAVVGDQARADLDHQACAPSRRSMSCPVSFIGSSGRPLSRWMRFQPALDRVDELAAALAVDRGDREHRALPAVRLDERCDARVTLARRRSDRACSAPASAACRTAPGRSVRAPCTIARASGDRIGVAIERRDIDDVQQQSRALQMAQELMAESGAFGGAFDQARECRRRRSCGSRRRAPRRDSARAS